MGDVAQSQETAENTTELMADASDMPEVVAADADTDGLPVLPAETDVLTAANEHLQQEVAALTVERDTAIRERDEALAKLAEPAKPSAKAAPKPVKARKIPADFGVLAPADELMALINGADSVELAFSNGKTELAGLAPLTINGSAWKVANGRLALTFDELIVHGPAVGFAPYAIAAYGLFVDGDLVAVSARDGALTVGEGGRVNIAGDVLF